MSAVDDIMDSKVVELLFNNNQFEDGVEESISSLDKLEEALANAGKNIGTTALENATYVIADSFNALEIAVNTVVYRITNSVIDMVATINSKINEVTFQPIYSGFSKYEEQVASVQTMMTATGKTIDEVSEQLEKLMWYTDETSYSYSQMSDSVAKFVSAGVSLDDSVTAMIGIANWAGAAGANVSEASRAMYNLAQAIAKGNVTAQDWASINTANMSTHDFKQAVVDTAKEMKHWGEYYSEVVKTMKQDSDEFAAAVEKNGHTIEEVQKYLNYATAEMPTGVSWDDLNASNADSLLSSKWLTSDVLLETLKKYGNYTEDLYRIYNEGDFDTANEAIEAYHEQYSGLINDLYNVYVEYGKNSKEFRDVVNANSMTMQTALDLIDSRNSEIYNAKLAKSAETFQNVVNQYGTNSKQLADAAKEAGYSLEEAIDIVENGTKKYEKVVKSRGEQGFTAGQEAKTFTDAWGSAIEAASSQWLLFWQTIIGNYEEAKTDWTAFSNTLWEVFAGPISQLNDIASRWAELGGRDELISALKSIWDGLNNLVEPVKSAMVEIFPILGEYEQIGDIFYQITLNFKNFVESFSISTKEFIYIKVIVMSIASAFQFMGEVIEIVWTQFNRLINFIVPGAETVLGLIAELVVRLNNLPNYLPDIENKARVIMDKIIMKVFMIKNTLKEIGDTIKGVYYILAGDETVVKKNIFAKLEESGILDKLRGIRKAALNLAATFQTLMIHIKAIDWSPITNLFNSIKPVIDGFINFAVNGFLKLIEILIRVMDLFTQLVAKVLGFRGQFGDTLKGALNGLEGFGSMFAWVQVLVEKLTPVFQNLWGTIKGIFNYITTFFSNFNLLKAIFINGLISLTSLIVSNAQVIEDTLWALKDVVLNIFSGGTEKTKAFFSGLFTKGKNVFKDLLSGITSSLDEIFKQLANIEYLKYVADMLKSIGMSLLMIAGAAIIFSSLSDPMQIVAVISGIGGAIAALYFTISKIGTTGINWLNGNTLSNRLTAPFVGLGQLGSMAGMSTLLFSISASMIALSIAATTLLKSLDSVEHPLENIVLVIGAVGALMAMTYFMVVGLAALCENPTITAGSWIATGKLGGATGMFDVGRIAGGGAIEGGSGAISRIGGTNNTYGLIHKFDSVSRLLTSVALSLIPMTIAVKILGSMNIEDLAKGLFGVGVELFFLYLATKYIATSVSTLNNGITDIDALKLAGKNITRMAAAMSGIAIATAILTAPVIFMGKLDLGSLVKGILATIVLMVTLFEFVKALVTISKELTYAQTDLFNVNAFLVGFSSKSKLLELITAIIAIAASVTLLSVSLFLVGTLPLSNWMRGLSAIIAMVAALGAFAKALTTMVNSEAFNAKGMLAAAASLAVSALAIMSISASIILLGTFLNDETFPVAAAGVMATLIVIFMLIISLSQFAGSINAGVATKMLALAGSLAIVSLAIDMIAAAIIGMSLVGEDVGYGLAGLTGALAEILIMIAILSNPKVGANAITMLEIGAGIAAIGVGLWTFSKAIDGFSKASFGEILAMLIDFAVIVATVAAVTSLLSSLNIPILTFAASMVALGAGMWLVGEGISAIHKAFQEIAEDKYVRAFGDAITEFIMPPLEKLYDLLTNLIDKIGDLRQKWVDFWETHGISIYNYANGQANSSFMPAALAGLGLAMPGTHSWYTSGYAEGSYLKQGVADGSSGYDEIADKNVTEYETEWNERTGTHSPSEMMREKGYYMLEGFKEGTNGFDKVAKTDAELYKEIFGDEISNNPVYFTQQGEYVVASFSGGTRKFYATGQGDAKSYTDGLSDKIEEEAPGISKLTRRNFAEKVEIDEWHQLGMYAGEQYIIGMRDGVVWKLGQIQEDGTFTAGSYLEALRQASKWDANARSEIEKYVTFGAEGITDTITSANYRGMASVTDQWDAWLANKNKEAAEKVRNGLGEWIADLGLAEGVKGFLSSKVESFTSGLIGSGSVFDVDEMMNKFKSAWGRSTDSEGNVDVDKFNNSINDALANLNNLTDTTYSFGDATDDASDKTKKATKSLKNYTSATKDYNSTANKATELTNKYTTALGKLGAKVEEEESKLSEYNNSLINIISSTLGDTESLYDDGYTSGTAYANGFTDGMEDAVQELDAKEYTRQRNIVLNADKFGLNSWAVQHLLNDEEKELSYTDLVKLVKQYRSNVKETDDYVAQNGYNIAEANRLENIVQEYTRSGLSEDFKNYVIDDLIHSTDELKTDAEKKDQALEDLQSAIDNGYLKITMTDADIEKLNGAESSYKDVYAYLGKYAKTSYFQGYLEDANDTLATMNEYLDTNMEQLYKSWTLTGDKVTFKQLIGTKGIDDAALQEWVQTHILDVYADTKTEEKWENDEKAATSAPPFKFLLTYYGNVLSGAEKIAYGNHMNSQDEYYEWKSLNNILTSSWITDDDFVKTALEEGLFSSKFSNILSILGIDSMETARSLLNDIITNEDVVKYANQYGVDSEEFENLMWIRGYDGDDQADYKQLVEEAIIAGGNVVGYKTAEFLTQAIEKYNEKKGKETTGATTTKKATVENTEGNTVKDTTTSSADTTGTTADTLATDTGNSIKVTSDNTKSISENVGMIVTKIGNLETKLDSVLQKIGDVITKQDTINTSIANSTDSICNSGVNVNIKNYAYVKSKLAGDLDKILGSKFTAAYKGN